MAWAVGIPAVDRFRGVDSFLKLLVIPLLIFHYTRSERGHWVLIGYFVSCIVLLILSWIMIAFPTLLWQPRIKAGVPVRDYIAQSGEFTVCIFVLAKLALDDWRNGMRRRALGLLALAAVFVANIIVVSFSRTVLMVFPVLLLAFAWKFLSHKATLATIVAAIVVAAISWSLGSQLQKRILEPLQDIQTYSPDADFTSGRARLDFWRRSIEFVRDAPVIGHGTGSIRELFRRAAEGRTGVGSDPTTNPHSQIFAVAVQLGFLGTVILFAFWIAHLMVFRGDGLVAWTGLVIVVQNIVGSLFNSHLFDFTQGWGYVLGVGVAAGMVFKRSLAGQAASAPRQAVIQPR
jgi:hypothetical protein